MKNLILFTSKHGTTEKCVFKLKENLESETTVANINAFKPDDISEYHNVIIGAPIYAGKINKKMKSFIQEYKNIILKKNIFLFLCCGAEEKKWEKQMQSVFPQEFYNSAIAKENFGYEYNLEDMNIFEKTIIKKIAKIKENKSCINEKAINALAGKINETKD